MKGLAKILVVVVAAFSMVALMLGGCAPEAAPPPEEVEKPEYLSIVWNTDISGPYGPCCATAWAGLLSAITYFNEEGGTDGVPWRLIMMDTGYSVEKAIAHLEKCKSMEPRPVGMVTAVSPEAEALHDLVAEAEIPLISSSAVPTIYPAAYSFGYYPLYPDMFGVFINWLVDEWWPAQGRPGQPKLARLCWDTSFGRAILTAECDAYAKEKGVDIVATELYPLICLDTTMQLTRIKATNADFIVSLCCDFGVLSVLKSAREMGYEVPLCFVCPSSIDPPLMSAEPEIWEGVYGGSFNRSVDDRAHPGVAIAREYFERIARPEKEWGASTLFAGWSIALTFKYAVDKVVAEQGWEHLSGKAIKEALTTMRDVEHLHGINYVSYTPDRPTPTRFWISRVINGEIQHIYGDPKGAVCPDLRPPEFRP